MMKAVLFAVIVCSTATLKDCVSYDVRSVEGRGDGVCPSTQKLRESIQQDVVSLISVMQRPCGCGGPGWRRVAYLNMSDTTQTCPGNWSLITSPKRSCARPSDADLFTCYSAFFQSSSYSQVCGRIIGYQVGQSQAFLRHFESIEGQYVDGVSLTYGNPRQHIWTFAVPIQEDYINQASLCPCNGNSSVNIPSYVGNDYFCETGVPTGEIYENGHFYADDPLWDGQGCGPTSTCCTFNNPPWFCKQLPQSTNDDLEIRICSPFSAYYENTAIELVEIFVQ